MVKAIWRPKRLSNSKKLENLTYSVEIHQTGSQNLHWKLLYHMTYHTREIVLLHISTHGEERVLSFFIYKPRLELVKYPSSGDTWIQRLSLTPFSSVAKASNNTHNDTTEFSSDVGMSSLQWWLRKSKTLGTNFSNNLWRCSTDCCKKLFKQTLQHWHSHLYVLVLKRILFKALSPIVHTETNKNADKNGRFRKWFQNYSLLKTPRF